VPDPTPPPPRPEPTPPQASGLDAIERTRQRLDERFAALSAEISGNATLNATVGRAFSGGGATADWTWTEVVDAGSGEWSVVGRGKRWRGGESEWRRVLVPDVRSSRLWGVGPKGSVDLLRLR